MVGLIRYLLTPLFSPPILEAKCSAFTKLVLHFSGITIAILRHSTRHDFYLCMNKEKFVIFIIYKCYNKIKLKVINF